MRAGWLRTSTAVVGVTVVCALALGAVAAEAGSWHLVSSFGNDGVAGLPLRERSREEPSQGFALPERSRSLTVAGPQGSLYVGGFAVSKPGAFLLARMSAAGKLVKSFGRGGVLTVPAVYWFKQDPPRLFALAGGRLLIVGLDHGDQLVAVELSSGGQFEHGFGHDGVAQYALVHAHGFTTSSPSTRRNCRSQSTSRAFPKARATASSTTRACSPRARSTTRSATAASSPRPTKNSRFWKGNRGPSAPVRKRSRAAARC